MGEKTLEIELVSVNFIPKIGRWKQIGQMAFPIENLPEEMQDTIREIVAEQYREQYAYRLKADDK